MTALLLMLQLVLLVVVCSLMLRLDMSPVLSTSLLAFTLMWYTIPIVLSIAFWNELSSFVEIRSFVSTATLETATLLCTLTALLLFRRPYWRTITQASPTRFDPGPGAAVVLIAAGLALDFYVEYAYGDVLGDSYLKRNAFFVNAEGTSALRAIGTLNFIQVLLTSFGYVCLLTDWGSKIQNRLILMLVATSVGISVGGALIQGSRIVVLKPLLLLVVFGRMRQWPVSKLLVRTGAVGLVTFACGGLLIIVVGSLRTGAFPSPRSIMSSSAEFLNGNPSSSNFGHTLTREVVVKLDGFSTGAFLLERMGTHYAGWQPYVGSVLSIVPRSLLTSKSVPGSVDGTYSGHPSRLMAVAMGMDAASGNVNVSPNAIAMWQLGYLGLFLMVACNTFYLILINSLLLSPSLLFKTLGVFAIGIPTFLTLFASPDVVIMNAERLLVMYVLLSELSKLSRGISQSRRRLHSQAQDTWRGTLNRTARG